MIVGYSNQTVMAIILVGTVCNCPSRTQAARVLDGSQQKADVLKTDYINSWGYMNT